MRRGEASRKRNGHVNSSVFWSYGDRPKKVGAAHAHQSDIVIRRQTFDGPTFLICDTVIRRGTSVQNRLGTEPRGVLKGQFNVPEGEWVQCFQLCSGALGPLRGHSGATLLPLWQTFKGRSYTIPPVDMADGAT